MMASVEVKITPAMMAQAFWGMGSDQQAEFFSELAKVVASDHFGGNTSAYSLGELQWHHMADHLNVPLESRQPGESYLTAAGHMLQTMAAPLFLHTLRAAEVARGW